MRIPYSSAGLLVYVFFHSDLQASGLQIISFASSKQLWSSFSSSPQFISIVSVSAEDENQALIHTQMLFHSATPLDLKTVVPDTVSLNCRGWPQTSVLVSLLAGITGLCHYIRLCFLFMLLSLLTVLCLCNIFLIAFHFPPSFFLTVVRQLF